MSNTYVTSDIHFFHQGILKFCPKTRPYADIKDMHSKLIAEWNSIVQPEDLVYVLGDISFGGLEETLRILWALNGEIILVQGNHDYKLLKNQGFRDRFKEVHSYLELEYKKTKLVMFHYPILEWNACHWGAVHLHGHTHGDPTGLEKYRVRDVGVDATGKVVQLLDAVILDAKTGEKKPRH